MAALSRLELTKKEKTQYARQLGEVLSYVAKVQGWMGRSSKAISSKAVSNREGVIGVYKVEEGLNKGERGREKGGEGIEIGELREDKAEDSEISPQDLLKNAPEVQDNFVKVPGVFE